MAIKDFLIFSRRRSGKAQCKLVPINQLSPIYQISSFPSSLNHRRSKQNKMQTKRLSNNKKENGGDPPTVPPPSMRSPKSILLLSTKQNTLSTQVGRFNTLWSGKSWRHRPRDNRFSGMNSDLGLTGIDMTLLTS